MPYRSRCFRVLYIMMVLVEMVGILYPRRRGLKQVLHALLVIPYKLTEVGFICPTLVGPFVTEVIVDRVCPDLLGIHDTLQSIMELLSAVATDGTIPLCPLLFMGPWCTSTVFRFPVVTHATFTVGVRIIFTTGCVR